MNAEISKHAKDIIQKHAGVLFKNSTLDFFGIKTAGIKEILNVEQPVVEVKMSSSDLIFLLEDDTLLHFEFQTRYSEADLIRFAKYDLHIYENERRKITTVIIYISDVKEADTEMRIGSMLYKPEKIMMVDYDGNTIYTELDAKFKSGEKLTDVDMLKLLFLPLMSNTVPRDELVINSVKLAQTIPDKVKRDACIAATFAFTSKYLSETKFNELLEAIKMTDLAAIIMEEGWQKGRQEGRNEGIIETAKKALRRGFAFNQIADITGLNETTIKRLEEEIKNES